MIFIATIADNARYPLRFGATCCQATEMFPQRETIPTNIARIHPQRCDSPWPPRIPVLAYHSPLDRLSGDDIVPARHREFVMNLAFKTVVVATDFGDQSQLALECGRVFATRFGANLRVLHVVEIPMVLSSEVPLPDVALLAK